MSITTPKTSTPKIAGFTLFELIITMMIISALVVFASARFGGSQGYDEFAYQARLISVLRNMQTRAMNDTRNSYCFQVNFDNSNNAFGPPSLNYNGLAANTCSSSIDVDNVMSGTSRNRFQHMFALASELNEDGVNLQARNSLGNSISYIGFDALGKPITSDAGNDNCASGCSITFSTVVATAKVCVESQGYVHAGECGD
ncbi:type II secretion system protein [Paraneptunicella aestuarii]|uniref:pilus assembly FimT family protein n=1 Tax=Paraneptunicella aestuarii TaxID=2831148 RepID=UPI001E503B42|nr:type II secretion system protein [Paraneptunicella aestuarii]UAA39096.1 type II secretion system protein [Paraneptunicella aestuarii]